MLPTTASTSTAPTEVLPKQVHQRGGVGAHELVDAVAVLVEDEGGHGADAELLSEFGEVVDVELAKVDLVLELGVLGPPVGLTKSLLVFCLGHRE